MNTFYGILKPILLILLLFGLCPFVVNPSKTKIYYAKHSVAYTIVHSAFFPFGCLPLAIWHISTFGFRHFEDVAQITMLIEIIAVLLVYTMNYILFIGTHRRHIKLLRNMSTVADSIATVVLLHRSCRHQNLIGKLSSSTHFNQSIVKHSIAVTCYYSIAIIVTYEFQTDLTQRERMFIAFFCLAVITSTISVWYIKQLGEILLHFHTLLLSASIKCECANDIFKMFKLMCIDLPNLTIEYNELFGQRLLINFMVDFILTTSSLFYIIKEIVYIQAGQVTWLIVFFAAIYVTPNIYKAWCLVPMANAIGEQVYMIISH